MADKSQAESCVTRVAKLPVVESTINAATGVYSKIKESNPMVTSVLNTTENAVYTAKEKVKDVVHPVTETLERPISGIDSLVCKGLDLVEEKVPQIKLPPHELYESAKSTVSSAVEPAVNYVGQGVQKVKTLTGFNSNVPAQEATQETTSIDKESPTNKKETPVAKKETPILFPANDD